MNRFAGTFSQLRAEGACGLFPYVMAGFPDIPTSKLLAEAALEAGADGFEIAAPFSDPLADGTTMQRVNARALDGGANLETALDLVRSIRQQSPNTPVALMSYYNPLRQRGDARIAADLASAGADAVIVPDVPAEEVGDLRDALRGHGLGLAPLLAPTSPPARIRAVAALEPVFIYCVALVGVTGARQEVSSALGEFLQRVKLETEVPLVVGFGISTPQHVRRVSELGANGAIVASALVDIIGNAADPIAAAREYIRDMKAGGVSAVAN